MSSDIENKNIKKESETEDDVSSSIEEPVNIVNISLIDQDKKDVILYKNKKEEFIKILRSLPNLNASQIRIIEIRYLNLISDYKFRLYYIDILYHFSRGFISIGSVIIPALLSIQSPSSNNPVILYWVTWGISICVTIFHNILTLFRFDKKYFGIHSTLEKLESEGWHYLELSGRYAHNHQNNIHSTHQNQFKHFTNTIEKIKMHQNLEEYNSVPLPEKSKNQQYIINEETVMSPISIKK